MHNAQFNLAAMYGNGDGVSQDHEKAVWWARKAANQGDAKAQELLACLLKIMPRRAVASGASSAQCASCGRGCGTGVKLKPCSRCKSPFYCGEDCQRKHWKEGQKLSCTPKE